MLTKRIIPCLDVDKGRVVKGTRFVDIRDAGDPVEMASFYDQEGADELVFLDITASQEERKTTLEVARHTAEQVFIPYSVGGGIRTTDDIRNLLSAGADKVSLNTAAVEHPEIITEASKKYGSQCIVVAIDARQVHGSRLTVQGKTSSAESSAAQWEVYLHGGRTPTGIDAVEWAEKAESLGAGEILLTSMDRDGTKDGYDIALTKAVAESVNIPVIASGGAGKLDHFFAAIDQAGADAVLAASLFHYGELTIKQVKDFLSSKGVPIRPPK